MRIVKTAALAVILSLTPSLVIAGPIYVYRDGAGVVHFSSKQPAAGVSAKVFSARQSGFSYYRVSAGSRSVSTRYWRLFRNSFNELIMRAAERHKVNAGLVKAMIHAESGFNPRAVSPKGALGLMQLLPENCRRYGVRNPFSPQENIDGGVRMIAELHRRFRGNLPLALAAYNAGAGAVDKYNGIPPYQETREYVRRVLELRRRYQEVL